uniref:Uncharacterized protein n=1 Tax=Anguilla anguilla TaxID=7936 RepID=A0A0E9XRJ4_ANGAN
MAGSNATEVVILTFISLCKRRQWPLVNSAFYLLSMCNILWANAADRENAE